MRSSTILADSADSAIPQNSQPRAAHHADQTLQHVYQYMAYLLQLDGATITESMSAVRKFAPKLATLRDELATFFAAQGGGDGT